MEIVSIIGLALAALSAVFAAPTLDSELLARQYPNNVYYLSVEAPKEPYNGRHLVTLPTSHCLGIENFTVHPETPPEQFIPEKQPSSNMSALRSAHWDKDTKLTPYLAVLISPDYEFSLKILQIGNPTADAMKAHPEACPKEYYCSADGFFVGKTANGILDLIYWEHPGNWEPVKDTHSSDGWIMRFNGTETPDHPVGLYLLPSH